MHMLLDSRATDAEAKLQKATQSIAELERKLSNHREETQLFKSQNVSLTQLLQETQDKLSEASKENASLTQARDECRRKVGMREIVWCLWSLFQMCIQVADLTKDLQAIAATNVALTSSAKEAESKLAESAAAVSASEHKCAEALKRVCRSPIISQCYYPGL